MNGHWSLWLGIATAVMATALSIARMILNGFSGGRLRRLEEIHASLAERLEESLQRRDEFRLLLRLFLTMDLFLIGYCLVVWDRTCAAAGRATLWGWLPLAAGGAVFLAVTEAVGRHLSTLAAGRLLAVSLGGLRVLAAVLFPVAWPVLFLHRSVVRWRDAHAEEHEQTTAEDEIMSLVEKDADNGNGDAELEDDERRMIRGIFYLDETLVHGIMTPRVDVHGIPQEASIRDVKARIVECGHSRIPVFSGTIDHVVGVVFAKDLLDEARVAAAQSLAELMRPPVFVPETKNVGDLLDEFRQTSNHFAVVLDEYGGTAGVVSIEDILEEIVGDIRDEYDADEVIPTAEALPDGAMVVDARTTVDEINQALELDLPEDEDFDTVGGYISS
ncbi:MAG: HlyC/CorC family transporter, partial [Lentisphaeria bacterium]|nr:HlyC/CorC family transporter [Lentisphaeria bacterium]